MFRVMTRRSSMPCSWSAWSWVIRTPSSRPILAASNCSRKSGDVSTRTLVSPSADFANQDGASAAAVFRIGGIAGAPISRFAAPPRRGTPPEEPQPRMREFQGHAGGFTLENRRKKLSVVAAASSSARHAFQLRQHPGGMDDKGGLVGLAPMRHGREERRVGLHQQAVQRHRLDDIAQGAGVLEGGDAGHGNIKPQLQRRVGQLACR